MCGFVGIVAYRENAPRVDRAELLVVRESMLARGPDGAGLWMAHDARAGLAHRRLAIIDLEESAGQPMASADGRLHVAYNGEIYNFRELRAALAARGHRFRTQSDTEVLLALYAERGAAMVAELRGMFAFAIWDERDKTLFLARDPFGVKPLYYADDGATLRFASQVKALLAGGAIPREPDAAGHVGFFVLGSVPEPCTMYRAVRALPAGCTLTLRRDGVPTVARYFEVREEMRAASENAASLDTPARREAAVDALAGSVRHHLVSDVPVGLFLSAGLDSAMVGALARRASATPIRSVTLAFDEYRGSADDEAPLAARTAAALGLEHGESRIGREDFERESDRLLASMDQPSVDGVNTWFVSRAAARAGMKVALSGLGADELFGGYPSFRDVPRMARLLRFARTLPAFGRFTRRVLAPFVSAVSSPKYAGLLEYGGDFAGSYLLRRAIYMPWEVPHLLDPAFFAEGWERLALLRRLRESADGLAADRERVAALEIQWFLRNQLLRDADWAGMAHSLEIRVPFVDPVLFRAAVPLLACGDANAKREIAAMAAPELPPEVLARRKTNFLIPVARWAADGARPLVAPPRLFHRERHVRGWARAVHRRHRGLRFLVLLSEAYGASGGIAKFNRDLLASLCAMPECAQVVAIPRLMPAPPGKLPPNLRYVEAAVGGKLRFVRESVACARHGRYDVVIAAHINLLPLAALAGRLQRAPVALVIHGIDAWAPRRNPLVNALARRACAIVAVSRLTLERFDAWAAAAAPRYVLPNCVDLEAFAPGPRSADLAARLGVDGGPVILTLGRMASDERSKGFDEVIEVLPRLVARMPGVRYLVCGDGTDRARLEAKVKALGLAEHVRFAGFVPEDRKADFYRVADAFVMPSRGEGFGIAFLEAAACGLPLVGSKLDGGREALLEGRLGLLVDPDDPDEIEAAICAALARPKRVPEELTEFSFARFAGRASRIALDIAHGAAA